MVDLPLPDAAPAPAPGNGVAARRLIDRVRAWQHRNPLARRIGPADVGGIGVIALPWGAAAQGRPPQPLFHQPRLLPGLSHRQLVDFARAHGVLARPGEVHWPQRHIERADASTDAAPQTRYLLTAAVASTASSSVLLRRLLIAPEGRAILGRRELSRPRIAVAVSIGLLLATAVPALVPHAGRTPERPALVASGPGTTAAATEASSPQAMSAASEPEQVPPGAVAASPSIDSAKPASAASPTVATSAAPAPTTRPSVQAPSTPVALSPLHPTSARADASPAASTPAPLLPMPKARAGAAGVSASAASASAPDERHYALVSAPAKKRAAADATLAEVHRVLGPAMVHLQAQVMPSPEGYVVTLWPLPTEADAQRLADVLARRGLPMKWLEF
jgi:hypothetical protein